MMIRQLRQFRALHERMPADLCLAFAGARSASDSGRRSYAASDAAHGLPRRPDVSVISEAIPLFYIGRNKNGLWVAREAEGRIGGIFLSRRSAVRFARESCEHGGCATMFVTEPLEFDFENRDNLPVAYSAAAKYVAECRVPPLLTVIAAVRKLFMKVSRALAGERVHREAVEKDLFGGRYMLCSKNDDDLPIVP
jgi:hypothetical protein